MYMEQLILIRIALKSIFYINGYSQSQDESQRSN